MTCANCVLSASWSSRSRGSSWGVAVDPFFRLPLWLRAECCGGHTLWAYNAAHLRLLEDCVAAKLRERSTIRTGMTLVAKLPAWLKAARNRKEILRTIAAVRAL